MASGMATAVGSQSGYRPPTAAAVAMASWPANLARGGSERTSSHRPSAKAPHTSSTSGRYEDGTASAQQRGLQAHQEGDEEGDAAGHGRDPRVPAIGHRHRHEAGQAGHGGRQHERDGQRQREGQRRDHAGAPSRGGAEARIETTTRSIVSSSVMCGAQPTVSAMRSRAGRRCSMSSNPGPYASS